VVHLAGGPGSSSLDVASYLFSRGLDAILEQRDFILFDQRGTGYSQPRLDCPERTNLTATVLGGALSPEQTTQAILDAFHRCRDRLTAQGIDLSAYNSAASAADLNDLRLALGYEKLNLYAVSYGTRLALTLMRDYPDAVRSAVIDSVYPLQVDLYTALAPNAERAFSVFFNRCAADPSCNGSYPDLRPVFYGLVDELNARPVNVPLITGGAEQNIRLDGGLLIDVLFVGLYNPAVTTSMPQMIFDIRQGDYEILRDRLTLYFDDSGALGMQMAVQCSEELPFNAPEDAYAAAQNVQPQIAAFYPPSVQPLFAVCKEWMTAPPDPRENLPVSSDLPTLVLAGEQDPITPPDWGRMVATDLSNSYFREFPRNGHWVTRSSQCALKMALAFWQNPGTDPGSLC
jgi:pimeloyl-ACP methyl ester carboxylesterase